MSEETNTSGGDTGGIAQLRDQFDAQAKELKALREENASLASEKRTSTVKDALKAKGLDENRAVNVASFYSGDDASEEAVGKWLTENADAFGVTQGQAQEQQTQQQQQVIDPNAANAQRVSQAAFGSQSPTDDSVSTPVVTGTPQEIQKLYEGSASLEQLQAMGLLPKNLNATRSAMDGWK